MSDAFLETLSLFQTKICDFLCPISDDTKAPNDHVNLLQNNLNNIQEVALVERPRCKTANVNRNGVGLPTPFYF